MAKVCVILVVVGVVLGAVTAAPNDAVRKEGNDRPPYIGCVDSSECGVGNCCVIAMGRYSIPNCQSVQEPHGSCRPYGHEAFNTTVSYPDGANVKLTNVYSLFCSCAPGLECNLDSSTCQDPVAYPNSLYNTIIV